MPVANIYSEKDRQAVTEVLRARSAASGSAARIAAARTWNRLEPAGTPFLYALFYLASSGDFDLDYRRFQIFSLLAYLAAVVGWVLLLRYPLWSVLPIVVLFTQFYWPFYTDCGYANVGQLQVGLLFLLVFLLRKDSAARNFWSGALLGFLFLFKPTVIYSIGLLATLWISERRLLRLLQTSAGGAVMLAIGGVIPSLVFGASCSWKEWRVGFPAILFKEPYLGGGFLGRLFGLEELGAYSAFGAVLFAVTAAVIVAAQRRQRPAPSPTPDPGRDSFSLIALGPAIYLLSGPIVHPHYFLLAVPLALLAMEPARPRWHLVPGGLAVFLTAAQPWLHRLGLSGAGNDSLWSFLGVWILALMVLSEFWRGRQRASRFEVDRPSAAGSGTGDR